MYRADAFIDDGGPLGFDDLPEDEDELEDYDDTFDPYDYYTDTEDEIDYPSTFD